LTVEKVHSINEPPCPLDEQNFRGCLTSVDGKLTYYINRRCKANLLWLFWFNCVKSPFGEDPSLENHFYPKLTKREEWVSWGETTIIQEEDVVKRGKNYPNSYRRSSERIDFYVTKPEFAEAYQAIQKLGRQQGDKQVADVVIFGSLNVVLLASAEFGERTAE
jgi:hypothetical protein